MDPLGPYLAGYRSLELEEFGAPSWMPGPLASAWDRASSFLSSLGENTRVGWAYMIRVGGPAARAVAQQQLETIADLSTRGAAWATNKVREKSRELERVYSEYESKKAEFDRKADELAKTDPARAEQIRSETYGAGKAAKEAFLRATSRFAEGASALSGRAQTIIRRMRAEAGLSPVQLQGSFGDAGVISVPTGAAVGAAAVAVVAIVATIYLLKSLLTDLTTGTQQVDQSLFEVERQRLIAAGYSEEEARKTALSTVDDLREDRFNLNKALPWVFGIALAGIGLPAIYKGIKEVRG